jgi:hypothetical protein
MPATDKGSAPRSGTQQQAPSPRSSLRLPTRATTNAQSISPCDDLGQRACSGSNLSGNFTDFGMFHSAAIMPCCFPKSQQPATRTTSASVVVALRCAVWRRRASLSIRSPVTYESHVGSLGASRVDVRRALLFTPFYSLHGTRSRCRGVESAQVSASACGAARLVAVLILSEVAAFPTCYESRRRGSRSGWYVRRVVLDVVAAVAAFVD